MKVAFLGATSGIGRVLARELAARGDELFLLGRNRAELEASARDLEARAVRSGVRVGWALCDLRQPDGFEDALRAAERTLAGLDAVILTAASFGTQEDLEAHPAALAELLDTNVTGTILFCEAARRLLLERGGGRLMAFGSVAGDRGRKPVVLYGATKAALAAYFEGLDHRYRSRGLVSVLVKPGFVRTRMTAGLPEPPFAADPLPVVRIALRALDRGTPVVYAPGIWRPILAVIRRLPRFLMRRLSF